MKILIIRFSSIGDIIQCMSITRGIHLKYPEAEIHWITRKDMAQILYTDPNINKVWEFNRESGVSGLIAISNVLRKMHFNIVYDAHFNIRSFIVRFILGFVGRRNFFYESQLFVRNKKRLNRILFFTFNQRRAIPLPFRGMVSFQKPLKALNIEFKNSRDKNWVFPSDVTERVEQLLNTKGYVGESFITLIPSAAWELKRWPVDHWRDLVMSMPGRKFIIIAGPDDSFTKKIEAAAPDRVFNLFGKTSLIESFYLVYRSHIVVSADTGFLHAADLFGIDSVAFMGPTAFGHTTGKSVRILEIDLPCRPCSKEGKSTCKIAENKKCLVDITPAMVKQEILSIMQSSV